MNPYGSLHFSMDAWRMKHMKETKQLNLQRRRRKLTELLEKERLEHTVSTAAFRCMTFLIKSAVHLPCNVKCCFLNCIEHALNYHSLTGRITGLFQGQLCSN